MADIYNHFKEGKVFACMAVGNNLKHQMVSCTDIGILYYSRKVARSLLVQLLTWIGNFSMQTLKQ